MKRFIPWIVGLSLAINLLLLVFLLGSRSGFSRIGVRDNAPILLQRIQSIGKLHTIRHTFERTGSLETFQNADPSVAWIPGVEGLVHSATSNQVVMTLRGSVESGIDFTKVKLAIRDGGATVTLPRPETYEPTVTAELHDVKRGTFWRDEEIQLKAIESAKREFRNAAIQSGAREEAVKEAKTVIGEVLKAGGVEKITFADS